MLDLVTACDDDDGNRGCMYSKASTPTLGVPIPTGVVDSLLGTHSPLANAPEVAASVRDSEGFVVLTSVPSLEVYWEWRAGSSRRVGTVKAPRKPGGLSMLRLQASARQNFFVSAPGGAKTSVLLPYPGELAVVAVAEGDADGPLATELLDEDGLKIFLGEVGRVCAADAGVSESAWSQVAWDECLGAHAELPSTGMALPADLSRYWFSKLWGSPQHWQLCNHANATTPVRSTSIAIGGPGGAGATFEAHVLREDPLVLEVRGLATPEECRELEQLAGTDLARAYVSGGTHSRARRTLSRNLYPNYRNATSTLSKVSARLFDVTRQATGFELGYEGQEPLNWLYYKPGYEYRPHCDGGCGQSSVPLRDRVATTLLYCTVAEDGGGTVFPNGGLKLQPLAGSALLFTYNPDPESLSRHSACPVIRGRKTTATQWYRMGVDESYNWERAMDEGLRRRGHEL